MLADVLALRLRLQSLFPCVQQSKDLVTLNAFADTYLEWIFTLASDSLGHASLSVPPGQLVSLLQTCPALTASSIGLIASDQVPPAGIDASVCTLQISTPAPCWQPPFLSYQTPDPDRIQRFSISSGSTSPFRVLAFNHAAQERKLAYHATNQPLNRSSKVALTFNFAVNSCYLLANHCVRNRQCLVQGPLDWLFDTYSIGYAEMVPMQLDSLLETNPTQGLYQRCNHIQVIGGPLSSGLRQKSLESLCKTISSRYSANESWPIVFEQHTDGIGPLADEVQVKILPPAIDGIPTELKPADYGEIWVKSPTTVTGYWQDPAASSTHFDQEWFRTGDWGRLLPNGELEVMGRCDDIIINGGLKIAANQMEQLLLSLTGIRQVAITSAHTGYNTETLCIAIVPSGTSPLTRPKLG